MKDDFLIKIETWHKSDLGTQENVSTCVVCFTHLFNVTVPGLEKCCVELSIHCVPTFQMFVSPPRQTPFLASHINWIKLTPKHMFCVSTFASLKTLSLCVCLSVGEKGSTGCLHFHLALYFLRLGMCCHWSSSLSVVVSLQVHKLEPEVWKSVEAIYIDIADRSQVLPKVW